MRAPKIYPKESDEQAAVFEWAAYLEGQFPELRAMFHVPNGGARSVIGGAMLKREGVKSGVPDILLLVARGEYHGLAIELKRRDGGRLSKPQAQWIDLLNGEGYKAVLCYGADAAIDVIKNYLCLGDFFSVNVPAIEAVLGGICEG